MFCWQEIAVAVAKKEKEDAAKAAKEKAESEKLEAAEAGLQKLLAKADEVFMVVASVDGEGETITKEELVQAHQGDFKASTEGLAAACMGRLANRDCTGQPASLVILSSSKRLTPPISLSFRR